ncbi:MAG: UDP-N-acetylmuramoyl-L-alanyl-D-glutamate--2,6-diaminopimelate ligase [Actinomycetota bacterium]
MKLREVMGEELRGAVGDIEVARVDSNSRDCREGSLFFALPGRSTSGDKYIAEALEAGAVAVVTSAEVGNTCPSLLVATADMHATLVRASAAIVAHPERSTRLVGVTGTNGKTSVTTIVAGLWRAIGGESAVIGTLTHERTTPPPPELFRELAVVRDRAQSDEQPLVALEVSSHALDQGRVDGLQFEVAVFTNLSHDHSDYHLTTEAYFAAKASLFTPERCQRAVIWTDDPFGARLASMCRVPLVPVGSALASDVRCEIGSTTFTWRGLRVESQFSGGFNVDNSLLALETVVAVGVSADAAAAALRQVQPVPGRCEVVSRKGPTVIVDYAHTPDGLERILSDLRALRPGAKIIVVFGCGGDRDREKRPMMGAVATRFADITVITSDNPRHENPESIIDQIIAGVTPNSLWSRASDRRVAIAEALKMAGPNDVVVVAGKGHETTQIVGDDVINFDDRAVISELVK